jgi:hypothetical protein
MCTPLEAFAVRAGTDAAALAFARAVAAEAEVLLSSTLLNC